MRLLRNFKRGMARWISLRGGILPLALSEFVHSHCWNIQQVIWQPYVLSLGGDVTALGALRSVQNVLSSGAQTVTGRVCDRLGRKGVQVAAYALSVLALGICLVVGIWWALIPAVILFALATSLRGPSAGAMVAEMVPIWERGRAYGLYHLAIFLPAFYIPILGGHLTEVWGFAPVWRTILIVELVAFFVFLNWVRETLPVRRRFDLEAIFESLASWSRPERGMSRFYVAAIIDRFGWALWRGIFYGMLMQVYGLGVFHIGILHSAFFAAIALTQIPAGKLVDRYGSKTLLILSDLIAVPVLLGLIHSGSFGEFTLWYGLLGTALALWIPACGTYIANSVPPIRRAKVVGDLNAMRGLVAFPAPFIGSMLYSRLGFDAPLWLSLFFITLAAVMLHRIERR